MKFHKTITYKIKNLIPMMAIAGATLLPPACCKVEQEKREPHHNTTYVWGKYNWDAVNPAKTDNVAASADSTLVDNVFLLNDGASWEGSPTTLILEQLNVIMESVKPENRYKIRGAGILYNVGTSTTEQTHKDSIKLAQMGFKFGRNY